MKLLFAHAFNLEKAFGKRLKNIEGRKYNFPAKKKPIFFSGTKKLFSLEYDNCNNFSNSNFLPFPKQTSVFMYLQYKSGEILVNEKDCLK